MTGVLVLGLIAGWIVLWVYVFRIARNRAERVVAVLAAILIPFWDLPFGYLHFRSKCDSEGGLHVLAKITAQSSICTEASFGDSPQPLMQKGFDVVEFRGREKMIRYTRAKGGQLETAAVSNLASRYCLAITQERSPEWNIHQRDLIVRDLASQTVVARFTTFNWQGSWLKPKSMPSEGTRCFDLRSDQLLTLLRQGTGP